MKKAEQLQDFVDKAYDNFKNNFTNVNQVNNTLTSLLTFAEQKAKAGEFSCTFDLGNLDTATANATLFQRFLKERLEDLDYVVSFAVTVKENWVILDWTPEDF